MSTKQNSYFLTSLGKKYFMALTGLFLCIFLIGHLSGNLQLFLQGYEGKLQFNEYAVFMTTFPAVKVLSYLTYFSILFHVIDGVLLTLQNRKARPKGYAYSRPDKNTQWPSRNMAILGTLVLLFLVMHMAQFWARYHWDGEMPYMTEEESTNPLLRDGTVVIDGTVKDAIVYDATGKEAGPVMKDLHGQVEAAFSQPLFVVLYLIGLVALALHLWHGFSSAFQSLGLNHPVYTPVIKKVGYLFAVVIPLGFAAIPVFIFAMSKV